MTKTRQIILRTILRLALASYGVTLVVARRLIRQRPRRTVPEHLLLTATFYSDNWIKAHLVPLAASSACGRITIVASSPVPGIDKVTPVYPPAWLLRTVGTVPARLLTFVGIAIWQRPDWVGGVHLLVNGLLANVLARVTGARSLYFCVGGPSEVIGGGIGGENRIFSRLGEPDAFLERRLLQAVNDMDLAVTMGTGAVQFFRSRGLTNQFVVVSGGFDTNTFWPGTRGRDVDCVLVARLAEIKRIDVFLRAFRLVLDACPSATAAIVGDGDLRSALETQARNLGVGYSVRFVGHQTNVVPWLQRSRVFVLTSDSEGLALSLVEAMLCGAVPVVSDVGDLGDLVQHGKNGYLIADRTPEMFASRIRELLDDPHRLHELSAQARESAATLSVAHTSATWNAILSLDSARGR